MRELGDKDFMPIEDDGKYRFLQLYFMVEGKLEITVDDHKFQSNRPMNNLLFLFKDSRKAKRWILEIGNAKMHLNSGCSYTFIFNRDGSCDVKEESLAKSNGGESSEVAEDEHREWLFASVELGIPPAKGGRVSKSWHESASEEGWQYISEANK